MTPEPITCERCDGPAASPLCGACSTAVASELAGVRTAISSLCCALNSIGVEPRVIFAALLLEAADGGRGSLLRRGGTPMTVVDFLIAARHAWSDEDVEPADEPADAEAN